MRASPPDAGLVEIVSGINSHDLPRLADVYNRLRSPEGRLTLDQVRAYSSGFGYGGDDSGAGAFVKLLGEHPALHEGRPFRVGVAVVGKGLQATSGIRGDAATVLVTGVNALVQLGLPMDRFRDALLQVGAGADAFGDLLRRALGGDPLPPWDDIPNLPKGDLWDFGRDLERRSCLLGVMHALDSLAIAAAAYRADSDATGIQSLSPDHGCVGTHVLINGSGFGNAKPAHVGIFFPSERGGCVEANTIASWSDTQIDVVAPAGVGSGCVGFVRFSGGGGGLTLAEAASAAAGEMEQCFGLPAFDAAQTLLMKGSGPFIPCPPCLPNNANFFAGGVPAIGSFLVNGETQAEIHPGGALTLSWIVHNASSITITNSSGNELPAVTGNLNPSNGSLSLGPVPGTYTWDGTYQLNATNACGSSKLTVKVLMRNPAAVMVTGVEITQAIQFFDAAIHMANAATQETDNAVRLLEGKSTVVRVLVDSGQLAGFDGGVVKSVGARLIGTDTFTGAVLPGSPLAPLARIPTPAGATGFSFAPSASHAVNLQRRTPLTPAIVAAERMLPANRSFLFKLPATWTKGFVTLKAQVTPPTEVEVTDPAGLTFTQPVVFFQGGMPLRIALLRIAHPDTTAGNVMVPPPSIPTAFAEIEALQQIYPTTRTLVNVIPAPGGDPWTFGGNMASGGPGCGLGWDSLNAQLVLRAFFSLGTADRVFVGLISPSGAAGVMATGCGMPMSSAALIYLGSGLLAGILFGGPLLPIILARLGTCAIGAASAIAGSAPPGSPSTALSQEVGHAYGHFHVPGASAPPPFEPGWPDYEKGLPSPPDIFQSIGEFGLDVDDSMMPLTLRAFSPRSVGVFSASGDYMSYATPGSTWTSPFIYRRMLGSWATAPVAPPSGPGAARLSEPFPADTNDYPPDAPEIDAALVRGTITPGGVEVWPIYVHRRRLRFEAREPSRYHLELKDARGKALSSTGLGPLAFENIAPGEELEDGFAFAVGVEWSRNVASLAVLDGEKEIWTSEIPRERPELRRPSVKRDFEHVVVKWQAKHPAGLPMRYLVRYASGPERAWRFVAADITEESLQVRLSDLPGGAEGRFEVIASDGFSCTAAVSDAIEVPYSTPDVHILWPPPGPLRVGNALVTLAGAAITLEEGTLDGEAIEWRSSLSGFLGNGARVEGVRLSPGKQVIELMASSPEGVVNATSVEITVLQARRGGHKPTG